MASSINLFSLLLFLLLATVPCQSDIPTQAQFFQLINESMSGQLLSAWPPATGNVYCNYSGVACDDQGDVVRIDVTGQSLSGEFPGQVCSYIPRLRILRLGQNKFRGGFPAGVANCSFLEELDLSCLYLTGPLPDLSPLKALRILDLSWNWFSGDFPISITNLTSLEALNLNENVGLSPWRMPEEFTGLQRIGIMFLTTCNLVGEVPAFLGNMTSLVDLELSGNDLVGRIPAELGHLKNLRRLEMYYCGLEGEIPAELGNLTALTDLDLSVNKLHGRIPEAMCRLPLLRLFQMYNNSLAGEIPGVLAKSTTLMTLSLYGNQLTGKVPPGLGTSSALRGVDLSENRLSGGLPEGLCSGGKLSFLLVLQNWFSGPIPESYADCKSLVRFRVSTNNLEGSLPGGILSLPKVSVIDVAYNNLTGSVSGDIRHAKNLSELFLQGNRFSGFIPPEISLAVSLVKVDLSNNILSGPIPSEISKLSRLNLLFLQANMLNSSIPESLSSLKSLNVLDLSNNRLTGKIPNRLSELLPNLLNLSNNRLSGPIPAAFVKGGLLESFSGNPGLCLEDDIGLPDSDFPVCRRTYNRRKMNCVWLIGVLAGILLVGTVMIIKKWLSRKRAAMETDDHITMSSSFYLYDVKSFHRLSFDQREIIEAMVEKNILGYGGSGTVYRIELSNGEVLAVKELWSRKDKDSLASEDDQLMLNRELKTEVETLSGIRHKNIVKLYCYFSSLDCSLLVYEYMANGNLWDALHVGKLTLDWPTRYQIALRIAQGLAYLHHDLMPPIIHRDIKSTNILLDIDYQPKVADFGIAKVLRAQGAKDSSTAVIAGTYGYLAPEYAYSFKATTKCDVYSFGVVLMELVTGRKPVEADFGENKNITYWVTTKAETKEGAVEVLDKRVVGANEDDMIKTLRVAMRCTCTVPNLRPTMNEVVQLLAEAEPHKLEHSSSTKESEKP